MKSRELRSRIPHTGNKQARFDVLISNDNRTGFLLNCSDSIFKTGKNVPDNIFVQENASTDDPDQAIVQRTI